jgi:hypothetical protein
MMCFSVFRERRRGPAATGFQGQVKLRIDPCGISNVEPGEPPASGNRFKFAREICVNGWRDSQFG